MTRTPLIFALALVLLVVTWASAAFAQVPASCTNPTPVFANGVQYDNYNWLTQRTCPTADVSNLSAIVWPPNHKGVSLRDIMQPAFENAIPGIDFDRVIFNFKCIFQNEPLNTNVVGANGDGNTCPDGLIDCFENVVVKTPPSASNPAGLTITANINTNGAINAERSGNGQGRLYEVYYDFALLEFNGDGVLITESPTIVCTGLKFIICVPHDQGNGSGSSNPNCAGVPLPSSIVPIIDSTTSPQPQCANTNNPFDPPFVLTCQDLTQILPQP